MTKIFFKTILTCQKQDDLKKIARVTTAWTIVALRKCGLCNESEKEIFSDSRRINRLIANKVLSRECFDTIYEVFDSAKRTQAVALTKVHDLKKSTGESLGRYMKIVYLTTNPVNIRAQCNENEPARVQGAGRCIIERLAKECKAQGLKGIYVESRRSALKFYGKMHFRERYSTCIHMQEPGTRPMIRKTAHTS